MGLSRVQGRDVSHPLDGARLKIIRAQEHLDSLCEEIRGYLHQHPYEIVTEKESDLTVGKAIITARPPLRLSAIVGDCVANARAALDYIAWELAARYLDKPRMRLDVRGDLRLASFPLFNKGTDPARGNHLNGLTNRQMPAAAVDLIDAVQPYHGGQELWWLHELVNRDKHRSLRLTITQLPVVAWLVIDDARQIEPFPDWAPNADAPPPQAQIQKVQVNHKDTVYVALADVSMPAEPVDLVLSQIVKAVVDVIPRFDGFF